MQRKKNICWTSAKLNYLLFHHLLGIGIFIYFYTKTLFNFSYFSLLFTFLNCFALKTILIYFTFFCKTLCKVFKKLLQQKQSYF